MLKYYPISRVKKNLVTQGGQLLLNGENYKGHYYETFEGDSYTGKDPVTGTNQLLERVSTYPNSPLLTNFSLPSSVKKQFAIQNKISTVSQTEPVPYYPNPTSTDYQKGYIIRYFTKKINNKGYITEISEDGYNDIVNGTAQFDISIYQVSTILWKISGPLRTIRLSQYDIREGIVETNTRLTDSVEKTFLGMIDFIGGDYIKFAKPTS
jgi:hypothetical protein